MSFPARSMTSGTRRCRPPKLTPEALAKAIVNALKDGVEDIYPGDVAQEWLARWEESPKTLEREVTYMSATNVCEFERRARMTENPLVSLAADLLSGQIRVVDLTRPYRRRFRRSYCRPSLAMLALSDRGGLSLRRARLSLYWNNFSCGAAYRTHFDAPIHWVPAAIYRTRH